MALGKTISFGRTLVFWCARGYDGSTTEDRKKLNTTASWITTKDNISVACADCPHCQQRNVVARVASARSGFNSTALREIKCKQCHGLFTIQESSLSVQRYPREEIDPEYGLDKLAWIE